MGHASFADGDIVKFLLEKGVKPRNYRYSMGSRHPVTGAVQMGYAESREASSRLPYQ
jgi:hypothetical protein